MAGNPQSLEQWLVDSAAPSDPARLAAVRKRLFGSTTRSVPIHYILGEELGRGRFGRVHKATDTRFPRIVALKLIAYDPESSTELERLEREAHSLASLSHPHIVQIYDKGIVDIGSYFLAMEYVEGRRLDTWRKEARRKRREILEVFAQAAEGLAHAHHRDLIHRDFKPSNVIVGVDDRIRILDFGLAKSTPTTTKPRSESPTPSETHDAPPASRDPDDTTAGSSLTVEPPRGDETLDNDQGLTEVGAFVGTLYYAAPEQLAGGEVDARSDQFSFCVTLFEALYGTRPFEGRTNAQIQASIASGPTFPSRSLVRVPRWLRALLLRGLSPDPSRRYEDMDQIAEILRRRVEGKLRARIAYASFGAAAAAAFGVGLFLATTPPSIELSWEGAWPADFGPKQVEQLHGAAVRHDLESFEGKWLDARATYEQRSDRDPDSENVACLEAGKARFHEFVDGLRQPPRKSLDGRLSITPERIWIADSFEPHDCLGRNPHWERDQELATLQLQADEARMQGDYEKQLELLDQARKRVPRDLSRRSGLLDYHLGTAQMYTHDPAAWSTLEAAQLANGGDEQFLADVIARRAEVGVFSESVEPKEVAKLLEPLELLALDIDHATLFVARGHVAYHGGDRAEAKENYSKARALFESRPDRARNAFMIAYCRLHEAFMESWKDEPDVDREQLLASFDEVRTTFGVAHPAVLRYAIKVARVLENMGEEEEARRIVVRALEERGTVTADGDSLAYFDTLRARAEVMHLDIALLTPEGPSQSQLDTWRREATAIEGEAFGIEIPSSRHPEAHRVRELLIEVFGRTADLDAAVGVIDGMDRDARTKGDHDDVCDYASMFEDYIEQMSVESQAVLRRLQESCGGTHP